MVGTESLPGGTTSATVTSRDGLHIEHDGRPSTSEIGPGRTAPYVIDPPWPRNAWAVGDEPVRRL